MLFYLRGFVFYMKINKNIKHKRIIFTFLISYILILLIPIIIGSLAYKKSLETIEDIIIESNLSLLEQTKDVMDNFINEIEKMSYQMASNTKTKLLCFRSEPPDDVFYYDIVEYVQFIKNYWTTNNDFILNFFIYFEDIGVVVSSNTFYDVSSFYGNYFTYNYWDFNEFKEKILNKVHNMEYMPSAPLIIKDSSNEDILKESIICVQTLPMGFSKNVKGAILICIDTEKINRLLNRINVGNEGWVYVLDKNGRVVTGFSKNIKIDPLSFINNTILDLKGYKEIHTPNGNMMITYITSSKNGWQYVAGIPSDVIMAKLNNIKRLTIFATIIILSLGILSAYFLAHRNVKPFKSLIKDLKQFLGNELEEDTDEYSIIKDNINKIINKNINLNDLLEKQKPLLRMAFLNRLFNGDYNNVKEIEAVAGNIGLKLNQSSYNKYMVVIIIINGYGEYKSKEVINELNMRKLIIKNELYESLNENVFLYDIDENKISWLFLSENNNETELIKDVEDILGSLNKKFFNRTDLNIYLSFAIGNIYDSILDVWKSYNEALQVVNYINFNNKNEINWYNQMPKYEDRYSYSLDVELKLINYVKSGDINSVNNLLINLYNSNFLEKKLSISMMQCLVYDISGTLIKLYDQVGNYININNEYNVRNILEDLDKSVTPDEAYHYLIDGFNKLCLLFSESKKSHNIKLNEQIINIINSSYMQSNLSLAAVADQINLSETYLSQFFKEQNGENFINYLERVRIRHACELLSKTDLSINDIASCVGYNSDHVFRRAFKRVTGIAPSEYKNMPHKDLELNI